MTRRIDELRARSKVKPHKSCAIKSQRQKFEMSSKMVPSITHSFTIVMQSLLVFIILQLAQTKHSESASTTNVQRPRRQQADTVELLLDPMVMDLDSLYSKEGASTQRRKRSTAQTAPANQNLPKSVDACQSKMEVLTPYYATNSKGKLRTIVNSELMQQAIQVETCLRPTQQPTGRQHNRCNAQPECGCEQKYKWHRLLVLDPNEDQGASRGLFMDWFLFPSNCVCRCKSGSNAKQFLRMALSGTR